MTINIDNEGTITLYQGDSGEININGIDDTKSYIVYFAIQDSKRKTVGEELKTFSNNTSNVVINLSAEFTDKLKVPQNKPYEVYYYGIKICEKSSNTEDTLFISNSTYGDTNKVIVYPKKVNAL